VDGSSYLYAMAIGDGLYSVIVTIERRTIARDFSRRCDYDLTALSGSEPRASCAPKGNVSSNWGTPPSWLSPDRISRPFSTEREYAAAPEAPVFSAVPRSRHGLSAPILRRADDFRSAEDPIPKPKDYKIHRSDPHRRTDDADLMNATQE
jgi:hypothetical protein